MGYLETESEWNAVRRRKLAAERNKTVGVSVGQEPMVVDTGVLDGWRRKRRASTSVMLLGAAVLLWLVFAAFAITLLNGQRPARVTASAFQPDATPTPFADPLQAALDQTGGKMPSGRTNILLLGSDQRQGDPGFRTDVMVLVSIDADRVAISAVSFPRDLWVEVPGLYPMKINMVQGIGGFEATADMFEANFGVRPDLYVMTNFDGFVRLIDGIGGIDVEAAQGLMDSCDLPQAVNGKCEVTPGTVSMDGATALWYVRSRETSSDFDRLRRAQEVLLGVFAKVMRMNGFARIPELRDAYSSSVETNIDTQQMVSLLPVAVRVFRDPHRIRHFAINEEQSTPSWSWDGMWILLQDAQAVHDVLVSAGILE